MTHKVSFLHTSPPAIPPLMRYYGEEAPEFEISNLLEDGILRFLAAGDHLAAEGRLRVMIDAARETYGAEVAMITCSSVPRAMVARLQDTTAIPVLKIDEPMARQAVLAGARIGVAATFRPTIEPTTGLLREVAQSEGREVEVVTCLVDGAYDALLGGKPERHDELLVAGVEELARQDVHAIVLAQVSMARVLPLVDGRLGVPVLASPTTSLAELRRLLRTE